jgi:signal transduction histidine kinase/DNA-binding response OmpR family regulator
LLTAIQDARAELSGLHFLANGGEMGARMRAMDWSRTSLGPPQHWPQSLKTIVRVMLDSRYAMWMGWGPELTFFCNDAYLPTVGVKRDWVLGARTDAVWQEIWPDIGPRIEHVLTRGVATWDDRLLLFLERSGFREETYHTFSYSPVYNDSSVIAGLLCVVTEVTDRVIGERRLHALRDLAARTTGTHSIEDACQRAVGVMAQYPFDLPFAGLYLLDAQGRTARLAAASRELSADQVPRQFLLGADSSAPIVNKLIRTEQRQCIDDLAAAGLSIPTSAWPESVQQALLLPIKVAGHEALAGFALLGVSPRRLLDDAYLDFLELVANQIASTITDAQAYEAQSARAEGLAQLDRAKTTFFSNVSHEFRTPLTLIMGPLEEALRAPQGELTAALRDELAVAHRNSLRLQRLVNALLDFSRMEAGRTRASFEPSDLSALSAQLAGTFRTAVERAGLALEVECSTLPEPVYLDRELWEQIVLNLVSNAFKYTLSGTIRVTVRSNGRGAQLRIIDTGTGIPRESIPHLFERFYRVPNASARTFEGTGIGLALVHELVTLHGGTIEVHSELGRGSTFTVSLPYGSAHLPAQHLIRQNESDSAGPDREKVALSDSFVEEAMAWDTQTATSTDGLSETPGAKEGLILLVDDNADMRSYLRRLLSAHWNVITAADGMEALEILKTSRPDLVVSDVMMPRLDGFGLLAAIREDKNTDDLPVVMLSARAGEEARLEGINARANDYLVKPFTARELIARVRAQIVVSKLQREAKAAIRSAESANRAAIEALNRQLTLESEELRTLFEQAPGFTAVLKGRELTVAIANKAYMQLVGDRGVLGRPLFEAVPEMAAEPYPALLQKVLETGETFVGRAMPLRLQRNPEGPLQTVFLDLVCQAMKDAAGSVTGLLIQGNDVTEHKHMEDTLRESDRRKDEFLAMLAHELRNPLAPILNATELLSRTVRDSTQTKTIAELIRRQTAQMARLVEDLLDVSRITQGRIELRRESLEVGAIISQALETVDPLLRNRCHQVSVTKSYRPLYVDGDATRLVQCVSNVLTNAAKYTDPGGQIRLQIREQQAQVIIEISDNGVGISNELLPRVFDLFVQSDRSLDRSQGGLGIGLAVVKRLVEMHGGRVNAASDGVGRGARIEIRLPMMSAPTPDATPVPAPAIAARRILVVDDNVDAALSLSQLLEFDGHETHTVYGAKEALEQVPIFKPDVVLLDIGLPHMNGYEVARRLRQRNDMPHLRLVALTGYGQSEDRQRALAAGFDHHLAKPVDLSALERVLAQ